jgi:hypothetical protein
MSRSRKKTPIGGMSKAESDKTYKVAEHRAERRSARAVISTCLDSDDRHLHKVAYGDSCRSNKDGKQYFRGDERNDAEIVSRNFKPTDCSLLGLLASGMLLKRRQCRRHSVPF